MISICHFGFRLLLLPSLIPSDFHICIFSSASHLSPGVQDPARGPACLDVQTEQTQSWPWAGVSPEQGPHHWAWPQTCSDNPGPVSRSLSLCLAKDAASLWKLKAVYNSANTNKKGPDITQEHRRGGSFGYLVHVEICDTEFWAHLTTDESQHPCPHPNRLNIYWSAE